MIESHLIVEQPQSTHGISGEDGHTRARAMVRAMRDLLTGQNVSESNASDQEGYYFVIESESEISLHVDKTHQEAGSTGVAPLSRTHVGLLQCCAEMARRGYTLSLFLSPRALVLYVSE